MAINFAPPNADPSVIAKMLLLKSQSDGGADDPELQKLMLAPYLKGLGDTSPVQHPMQAVARAFNGYVTKVQLDKLMEGAKAEKSEGNKMLLDLYQQQQNGGLPAPQSAPQPTPQPSPGPMGALGGMGKSIAAALSGGGQGAPIGGPSAMPSYPMEGGAVAPTSPPPPMPSAPPQQSQGGPSPIEPEMQAIIKGLMNPTPAAEQPARLSGGNPQQPQLAASNPYLQKMLPFAQSASQQTGIDPRIIAAQSALETGYGRSAPGNNHFGIKSHGQPGGNVMPTKEFGPGGQYSTRDSFRAYPDMGASAQGYADFINKNPRYRPLKSAQGFDAQIDALQRSGYATDPNYGAKVRKIAGGIQMQPGGLPPELMSPKSDAEMAMSFAPIQVASGDPSIGIPAAPQSPPVGQFAPGALPDVQNARVRPTGYGGGMPQGAPPAPQQMAQMTPQPKSGRLDIQTLDRMLKNRVTAPIAKDLILKGLSPDTKTIDLGNKIGIIDGRGNVIKEIPKSQDTGDIREFEYSSQNPAFKQYQVDMKRAGSQSISIDQRGEAEFDKASAKHQAERFDTIVKQGFEAKANRADLNTLRELGAQIGTGKEAQVKAALGPYAQMLGVNVDKLGEIQAYEAITSKLAPRMRVPGSGATSDFEMRTFFNALPSLGRTPEGNAIIEQTMEAMQNHQEHAAEIASRAMNKEITPREADKLLRELPDPMTAYKEHRKQAKSNDAPVRRYNPATGKIE